MNELIKINYDNDEPRVLGRDLHEFLEVKEKYTQWFNRMCEYGFDESKDFCSILSENSFSEKTEKPHGGRPSKDHQLTISMAKEICMLQRNDKDKQARQYFISLEEKWNTPEMVMSRALKMAERQINSLSLINSELTTKNAIMQLKADYFDELVDRNILTSFRETSKELNVKESDFIKFLLEKKYIFRNKKGKLEPYAQYRKEGLFEVKECYNEKTKWRGLQTLITPKGRETFRLLFLKASA